MMQRPGRAVLTALGTILGVGSFVVIVGLAATAGAQISTRFTAQLATEITVEDTGGNDPANAPSAFPPDAEQRVAKIPGVREAGVWWPIKKTPPLDVTGVQLPDSHPIHDVPVLAASPGLLKALLPAIGQGRLYDDFHETRSEQVAVLGSTAARQLGIGTLQVRPAVLIDGIPFTVIGIINDVQRKPDMLFAILVPRRTAELLWGQPDPGARAKMLLDTEVGAAQVVASQLAVGLRPDAPQQFKVIPPPNPTSLRDAVSSDINALLLLLSGICLVIGAVGIGNTTLVAVLERVPEIGLRRALGARRRHIASQFLLESAVLGSAGGLAGTSAGVLIVILIAFTQHWTAAMPYTPIISAPLIGTVVGLAAGVYPAWRATRVEPVDALRR
jgi:putative ABC transport system permease protein